MTIDLPELPAPVCTYADHSYPAFTRRQMEEYAQTAVAAALAGACEPSKMSDQITRSNEQVEPLREALAALHDFKRTCRTDISRAAFDALKRLEAALSVPTQ